MGEVRYRKVSIQIWNDKKFVALSDDAQVVFLFLLTHPNMTMVGCMRHSSPGLAAEKRWPIERFTKGLSELSGNGFVTVDETAFFIALPNFVKHNPPDNGNVVRGFANLIRTMPECDLLTAHVHSVAKSLKAFNKARYADFAEAMREDFPAAFAESNGAAGNGLVNGLPIQEQEQEQEKQQEQEQEQEEERASSFAEATEDKGPPPPPPPPPPNDLQSNSGDEEKDEAGVLIWFPCDDGSMWGMTRGYFNKLYRTYAQKLDLVEACKAARLWLECNESGRKPPGEMPGWLLNWVKRDLARNNGKPPTSKEECRRKMARWILEDAEQAARANKARGRSPTGEPVRVEDVVGKVVGG